MSGYGYTGYPAKNGLGRRKDDWNKAGYVSDRPRSPVVVSSHIPTQREEYYVTKTEIVEQIRGPLVSEDRYSSPTKDKPLRDYADEDKWRRSSSPKHDRPREAEEYITKVHTEVSRPNHRFAPLNATHWRQTPTTYSYEDYDDYCREKHGKSEPIYSTDKLSRPNYTAWTPTPDAYTSSKTVNDINRAVEYLKEVNAPSLGITSSQPRYGVPISATGPKRDLYPETINSREVPRRQSGYNRPSSPTDYYTTAIDSREAARKYGGVRV